MILEHAVLEVRPGQEQAFEAAFDQAGAIISGATGFVSISLGRCVEAQGRYLLLVEWESLDDHVVGFRGSEAFGRWKALLHHFYEPFPLVEHYRAVTAGPS
ncbi:MAG: antibiotic biosynthesis monooxygenase family protein [Acidimicrobiales bacterium]